MNTWCSDQNGKGDLAEIEYHHGAVPAKEEVGPHMTPISFDQCVNWVLLDLNRNIYSVKRRKLGDAIRYTFYREEIEIGRIEGILGGEWYVIPTITNHMIEDLQRRGLSIDRENWPPKDDEFDRDFRRISGQITDKYNTMREEYWKNQELIRQYKERKGLALTESRGNKGKAKGGASRMEDREDWGEKVKKVQHICKSISEGQVLKTACQLEGITQDTYRNIKKRIGELGQPLKT